MKSKLSQKGFSLIELIIVVLIIGIIATLAIPNLLTARRAANEASAIATLRIMKYSSESYQFTTGNGQIAETLDAMFDAGYIQRGQFQDGADYTGTPAYTKDGYAFLWATYLPERVRANFSAKPINNTGATRTGTRNFIYLSEGDFYYYYTDLFDPANAVPVGQK